MIKNFQKLIFEKSNVKSHKEAADMIIISMIQKIISNLSHVEKVKILDIGCGGGQLLHIFRESIDIDIYGIDISKNALKIAKINGYKTIMCDVEKEDIPLVNEFFDIIIISDLVEHLIDPDNLLRESRRLLKNDGILLTNIPNISNPLSWIIQIILDMPPTQSARYKSVHVRDYTLRVMKLILRLNGFEIIKIRGTFIYPLDNLLTRYLVKLFPRFSEKIIIISKKGSDIKNVKDIYFDSRELLSLEKQL